MENRKVSYFFVRKSQVEKFSPNSVFSNIKLSNFSIFQTSCKLINQITSFIFRLLRWHHVAKGPIVAADVFFMKRRPNAQMVSVFQLYILLKLFQPAQDRITKIKGWSLFCEWGGNWYELEDLLLDTVSRKLDIDYVV